MADLRFRTFRIKVYSRLIPSGLSGEERQRFLDLLEHMDEDGMAAFFDRLPLDGERRHAVLILKEARDLGDRLNMIDRTIPVLPHAEIGECYTRLRALGDEIGNLEAAGHLS
jgi:hypothetical protein